MGLTQSARQIRNDIDPDHQPLLIIEEAISAQLTHQLVDHGASQITPGRRSRELFQRFGGEGSCDDLAADLEAHYARLENELKQHDTVSGPTAWRQRIELDRLIRIDAVAIISTVRKIRRVAQDLENRLAGDHLITSLETFDAHTEGLVALRDIAEHHDEYVVGQGRRDATGTEPGPVFDWHIANNDVAVTARGKTVRPLEFARRAQSLVRCSQSAADYHCVREWVSGMANPDFVRVDEDGSWTIIDESSQDEEQQYFAAVLHQSIRLPPDPKSHRPTCKECTLPV